MVSQAGRNAILQRVEAQILDNLGNPVTYDGPNQIGGPYNSSLTAKTSGTAVFAEIAKYGQQLVSVSDPSSGIQVRCLVVNNQWATYAGAATIGMFSGDAVLAVGSIGLKHDAVKGGWRRDAFPSMSYLLPASLATDNAALIDAADGCIAKRLTGVNAKASVVYIKLYDKNTAPASTDTPKIMFACPASQPFNWPIDDFIFQTGIGIRIVTGAAHNDNTAVAASDILGLCLTYSQ